MIKEVVEECFSEKLVKVKIFLPEWRGSSMRRKMLLEEKEQKRFRRDLKKKG